MLGCSGVVGWVRVFDELLRELKSGPCRGFGPHHACRVYCSERARQILCEAFHVSLRKTRDSWEVSAAGGVASRSRAAVGREIRSAFARGGGFCFPSIKVGF